MTFSSRDLSSQEELAQAKVTVPQAWSQTPGCKIPPLALIVSVIQQASIWIVLSSTLLYDKMS